MTSAETKHEANLIYTVLKAIDVLECLAAAERALSAPEVGRRCGMSRPTAYRLLVTLASRGYVSTTEDGLYRLGTRVLSLGKSLLDSLDLVELSKPDMQELSLVANETVNLAILDGIEVLYLHMVESSQTVRMHSKIGTRNPLYCTGLGKAVLAYLPAGEQRALLGRITLIPRTANTIVDKAVLVEQLKLIRGQGFAIDDVEGEEGGRCVAAPIFDYSGQVFAALSVSGPAYRFPVPRLIEIAPLVIKAAQSISQKLGYVPSED